MAKGLGKGLQALFSDHEIKLAGKVEQISISELRSNPYQPRQTFSEDAIAELAESISQHGILQPIIARKSIKGYEVVVGERRLRASKQAGLAEVPVVVREIDEQEMMELALIENLQREDLNAIEEATAYEKLMNHLSLTQEKLAKRVGKSRPHITNHLRLLQLPESVQQSIADGKLSMGHGRALLGLKDKQKLMALFDKVLKEGLSVREVETLVNQLNEHVRRETKRKKVSLSPFLQRRQDLLRTKLGTSVAIKPGKKKGKIEIDYFSEEDLERIVQLLNAEEIAGESV
ncbi:ParB/RepB/Spo0J family partition protein [bacterium LRH843]|nr:ParB/RepB/Spo0J family partition protein [bacterium LRH843]